MRFLTSSANEIYYLLKYAVKNQNGVESEAALTVSPHTKTLENETELEDERTRPQLEYGRIAPMAYAKSNLHEFSVVTAVHCLVHGPKFVTSHDFQQLHLECHLSDKNVDASILKILKAEDSYTPVRVTHNYTLRPIGFEN